MQPTEVSPIAPGYRCITPYLMVDGVAAFLEFLRTVFDAQVTRQYEGPNGTIGHAEVRMADSTIVIGDPMGRHPPMPAALLFYVTNVDTVYQQALEAGATSVREPNNEFYGDRVAAVQDKWDNVWWLATHVEDVSDDERKRRSDEKLAAKTSNATQST
ncbi:MAG: VOC family protein [Flavobacteriales bacterium]|nr:VOC family protein [Flavobacteriales bacterium]